MVFRPGDVGQDGVLLVLDHQAHGYARDGRGDGHARVH